jgi:LmbE family N-acetylglucosaminyl deacetylase
MRWIYVSPHYDDAVLSCGGLIWEQTQKGLLVEIWTICAGDAPPGRLSPLALDCHRQWGIKSARELVAARRKENLEAANRVGAETVDFSIPDCIYRRSPAGDILYSQDVFVPLNPVERGLDGDVAAALVSEIQPGDNIVGPLGIGGHLDHGMTRHAVERLKSHLWYYADIPYLLNRPEMLAAATEGLLSTGHQISELGLRAWQKGIAAYATQIPMLFKTKAKMKTAMQLYWATQPGFRLWQGA